MDLFKTKSLGATLFSEKIISGGAFTKAFVFEVITAGADTFQLPIYNGGTYDFNVDWGDGNDDNITAWDDAAANHSYAGAGTYIVSITGTINGWRFAYAGDKLLIYDISSWGPLLLGNNDSYFYGCINLTVSATDVLDITGTMNMSHAFRMCTALISIPSIAIWDWSSVITLNTTFYQSAFNQDIQNINFASLTNMNSMLAATPFNQDLSALNAPNVTDMSYLLYQATFFDQDIGALDITSVTDMTQFLVGVTLSTANYDALLIGWEAQVEQPNVTFHGGNSKYSAGAAATARAALVANGWTITDGGQV